MLETIREFALERLDETGGEEAARRRHFDFFLALASEADTSAEGEYGQQPELLLAEEENLRAAVDGAAAAGDLVPATELMVLLENFWVAIGPLEGARRYEELLARRDELPEVLRARALRCYAGALFIGGDYERSHRAPRRASRSSGRSATTRASPFFSTGSGSAR